MVLDQDEGVLKPTSAIRRWRSGTVVALSVLVMTRAMAQEIAIPVGSQVQLLIKALPFDRNFKSRVGSELVIGVVYQETNQASLSVMQDFIAEIDKLEPDSDGFRIRCIPLAIRKGRLDAIVGGKNVHALYVTPISGSLMNEVQSISRSRHLLTVTGVPQFVENGVAIGLGARGGRHTLLINLESAVAEGADFSSQLLNLARVIR